MRDFKVMKELVKALTYIGDAIAGKTVSDVQSTSNGYDGLITYSDGDNEINTSEGINIKDNNFTKLGDLFSENLINGLNASYGIPGHESDANFKVCTKIHDGNKYVPYVIISYSNQVLHYTRFDADDNEDLNLHFTTSDTIGSWTKDTVLTEAQIGQENH